MRILVTGGAGFIGSHIVDRYIKLGHHVVIIDNLSTGQKRYINPKATFYQADICNRNKIDEIFSREKPEVMNHHAAQMDVRKSVADPIFDAQVNIIGLLNLLESGRNYRLKRVIFASSGGTVYGETDVLPTSETEPTFPVSPYGISKLTSEHYLHFFAKTYGMVAISLRYGNVYGPRQNPHGEAGVVAIFTQKMLHNAQPLINGDGKQARDFVYVKDVVEANVTSLEVNTSVTVNIGTSKTTTVNTLYYTLLDLTHTSVAEIHGPVKPGELQKSLLQIDKAKELLHWQPKVELMDGLRETVAFFKNETH